jgi:hypothetical protein
MASAKSPQQRGGREAPQFTPFLEVAQLARLARVMDRRRRVAERSSGHSASSDASAECNGLSRVQSTDARKSATAARTLSSQTG